MREELCTRVGVVDDGFYHDDSFPVSVQQSQSLRTSMLNLELAKLHTLLITDGRGDSRRVRDITFAALAGGIRAVQLREPTMSAKQMSHLCQALRPEFERLDARLFVNDRADLVAAGLADGVQLGHRSLPPIQVREFLGENAVIGWSAHNQAELDLAVAADFVLISPLFPTRSKPGVAPLTAQQAAALIEASPRPALLLGGIGVANVAVARRIGGVGVAVMRAICEADDPQSAAAELVATADLATRENPA